MARNELPLVPAHPGIHNLVSVTTPANTTITVATLHLHHQSQDSHQQPCDRLKSVSLPPIVSLRQKILSTVLAMTSGNTMSLAKVMMEMS